MATDFYLPGAIGTPFAVTPRAGTESGYMIWYADAKGLVSAVPVYEQKTIDEKRAEPHIGANVVLQVFPPKKK